MRKAVNEVDPEIPLFDVLTLQEWIDDSLTGRRLPMLLSLGFGAVALFLAGVGIYGVLAYLVARRTREIGIRVALGSDAERIFTLVFWEGAVIVAFGVGLNVLGSWTLGRYLESALCGVRPLDPVVMVEAADNASALRPRERHRMDAGDQGPPFRVDMVFVSIEMIVYN